MQVWDCTFQPLVESARLITAVTLYCWEGAQSVAAAAMAFPTSAILAKPKSLKGTLFQAWQLPHIVTNFIPPLLQL